MRLPGRDTRDPTAAAVRAGLIEVREPFAPLAGHSQLLDQAGWTRHHPTAQEGGRLWKA